MPITASEILSQAHIILQDGAATRWPLTELVKWMNAGLREITLHKPTVSSSTVVFPLVSGTKQTLPDGYNALLRVTRNMTGTDPTYVGGASVTQIAREILDVQNPNWHDPARTPFRATVRHVIADPLEQRVFYVYPGNTGTGKIECIMSTILADIAADVGDDPEDIDSYSDKTIPIPVIYQSALMDYILSRAFSKDMQYGGAADRAQMHYQQFANALGIKGQAEMAFGINSQQTA